jgi:hypothetical protein
MIEDHVEKFTALPEKFRAIREEAKALREGVSHSQPLFGNNTDLLNPPMTKRS